MLLVASLICPKIWFVSDMQTENASTLTCSQHSWVLTPESMHRLCSSISFLSLCLAPNLGSYDLFSPGDLYVTALQWIQT